MTFLSGEAIEARLQELIYPNAFRNNIDCNSYTLTIGPEVFVTTGINPDPSKKGILRLSRDDSFTIESGQFAILMTEEYVNIPHDLMGFISMKSKFKFLGLINVSGFHVDPGWRGRLLFTVYNSGPHDITLKQGEKCFSIWFANLDRKTKYVYSKEERSSILSDDINKLKGQLFSPQLLAQRIDNIEKVMRWKIPATIAALLVTLFIGVIVGFSGDFIFDFMKDHFGFKQEVVKEIEERNKSSSQTQIPPN